MENQKPKFLIDNLPQTIDITDEEISTIRKIILSHISIEELFDKVNPALKDSFLSRRETFKDFKFDEENFIKIPKEKMNLEETFLNAFFGKTNIKDDLNELLEYMNKMFEIIRYDNETKVDKLEDSLIPLVIKNALTNHYAAKIKLLYPDAEDDEINYKRTPR